MYILLGGQGGHADERFWEQIKVVQNPETKKCVQLARPETDGKASDWEALAADSVGGWLGRSGRGVLCVS